VRRAIGLTLPLLVFVGCVTTAVPLSVVQPNSTNYTTAELTTLEAGLSALRRILSDTDHGSHRPFTSGQWGSRDFAAYTAGVLTSLGYATHLVAQANWPDGTHTWVLAGLPLGGRTTWIPVEASPLPDQAQESPGSIPSRTDSLGQLWFDERYLSFSEEVQLPPNVPPSAVVRFAPGTAEAGDKVTLLGTDCVDPDGEIVRYLWTLSDGTRFEARNVEHVFTSFGTYSITLTVTDSRGTSATATATFVVSPQDGGSTPPPPSCNCRGGL
jgi:hypothetical protein